MCVLYHHFLCYFLASVFYRCVYYYPRLFLIFLFMLHHVHISVFHHHCILFLALFLISSFSLLSFAFDFSYFISLHFPFVAYQFLFFHLISFCSLSFYLIYYIHLLSVIDYFMISLFLTS